MGKGRGKGKRSGKGRGKGRGKGSGKGKEKGMGKGMGRVKPFFRDKSGIFPLKIGHIIFWTLSVPNIPDICTMLDNVSNIRFLNKQT